MKTVKLPSAPPAEDLAFAAPSLVHPPFVMLGAAFMKEQLLVPFGPAPLQLYA